MTLREVGKTFTHAATEMGPRRPGLATQRCFSRIAARLPVRRNSREAASGNSSMYPTLIEWIAVLVVAASVLAGLVSGG
jgi:hypothetical protein